MDVSTCRHLIEDLLSSYVDGELDNLSAQKLELHMQICAPCAAFLRTFLATKRAARASLVQDHMPEDCEKSLWGFLEKELDLPNENSSGSRSHHACCGERHEHKNEKNA